MAGNLHCVIGPIVKRVSTRLVFDGRLTLVSRPFLILTDGIALLAQEHRSWVARPSATRDTGRFVLMQLPEIRMGSSVHS